MFMITAVVATHRQNNRINAVHPHHIIALSGFGDNYILHILIVGCRVDQVGNITTERVD